MSADLNYLSAVELLAAYRAGSVSPVEVMRAVLRRADEVEPRINAFAYRYDEAALAAAAASEARYRSGDAGPLDGLPIAVKMDVDIAGQPGNLGSQLLADRVAGGTAALPRRILDHAGIIHARTTMPEFGVASFTHTDLWGETRNPWQLTASPGGSSGGSAASLAAGTSVLATGGDSAGSIRMPACFCGVVGYKPPRGRIPISTDASFDALVSAGPLARTVADCALFFDALTGPDPDDPWALPAGAPVSGATAALSGWRIGVSTTLGGFPVEPEIRALTEAAARGLSDSDAEVELIEPSWNWEEVLWAGQVLLEFGNAADAALPRELLMPYVSAFLDGVASRVPADFQQARRVQHQAWHAMRAVFERCDVLIAPTQGLYAFAVGDSYVDHGPIIDGVEARYPFTTHMGLPFNVLNSLPVLAVPVGRCRNGMPTGVQIIGRSYDDRSVFEVGMAIERNRGDELSYRVPGERPSFQ